MVCCCTSPEHASPSQGFEPATRPERTAMDPLDSFASWQPDPDTRELLVALLEALSIPAPARKRDRAAYCGVLADRATCARLTLGGLLADRPGINLAWEVSHLRQQLADHLPTYQHAPQSDPTAKAGDPRRGS
jgi:hypothetical protein